jgi:hypothetical protein
MRTCILIVIAASFFPLTIGAQEPKATLVTPQRVIQVKALFNACARASVKIRQAGESTYHFKCNEPAARRFGGKLKQMGVNSTHFTSRENNQEGIACLSAGRLIRSPLEAEDRFGYAPETPPRATEGSSI